MAAKIFRINYKSDFILTMNSEAGWTIPFCIKFWTSIPMRAYYVGFDGTTYTHCAYDPSEPTKLLVQFDDHHLPIGMLKFQIAYHFTVEDFPNNTEDEVFNATPITTEIDGETYQVMLDFTGETAPGIDFNMPSVGVTSVNGKIGAVTLNAEDVGAQPTIEDLAIIRSGAAEGATAVQPAALQEGLATKQDVISDLSTIRSGAAAGATAVQPAGLQEGLATKQDVISDLSTIRSGAAAGATAVQPATLQEGLAGKQDTISDLATIRSGAAAGATAVQPAALTPIENDIDAIEGKIPSAASVSNQLADKAFVNSALSGKADAADIPTALSQLSQDSTHRVVTDAEKSTWNGKQNAIDDLATIRSGAAAGATAVQPAALQEGLATKQDVISDLSTIRSGAAAGAEAAVRPYNTQSPDGMGYLVLDKDATFASQVTTTNTIYEIRYDYDLNGQTVTIPAGCVLKFNGGSISNGSLVGNNSVIIAYPNKIFNSDLTISGTWNIDEAYPEWFGAKGDDSVDDAISINACITSFNKTLLTKQNYYTTQSIALKAKSFLASRTKGTTINYKGTTDCVTFERAASESIVRNITFIGNYNTFATDSTVGLHFNETEVGRGILLDNLSINAFNTGVKAKKTFWGSFITNCIFGYCNIQLDIYEALNIHISGCYFSTPSNCCCTLEAARCISFANCNFGCENTGGSKFFNIYSTSSCTFTDCNFEVCYVKAADGAANVQGGSVVTMTNCRFHSIKRASSYTGNCNIFYVAGGNAVNLTLINCVFYENGDGSNYRLYYFFVHAAHHRVYLSGNRKTIQGLDDSSFTTIDVYSPDMSVFQEIATKTLGT